jgi:hypothetical protein
MLNNINSREERNALTSQLNGLRASESAKENLLTNLVNKNLDLALATIQADSPTKLLLRGGMENNKARIAIVERELRDTKAQIAVLDNELNLQQAAATSTPTTGNR